MDTLARRRLVALSSRSTSVDVRRGDERQKILRIIRARGVDSTGKIKAVGEDDDEEEEEEEEEGEEGEGEEGESDDDGAGGGDLVMDGHNAALEDCSRPGEALTSASKPVPLTGRGKQSLTGRKGKGKGKGEWKGKGRRNAVEDLPSISSYNRIGGTPLVGLDFTYQDAREMLQVAAHKEVFPVVKAVHGRRA